MLVCFIGGKFFVVFVCCKIFVVVFDVELGDFVVVGDICFGIVVVGIGKLFVFEIGSIFVGACCRCVVVCVLWYCVCLVG